ncbi:MAG TPA: YdeI/OmpD-associated family protein [Pyrinomonadaceae bacterium]|nr:YdeI/OmpD-associated family protein [Pyrinomonadaceae bacterium]
MPKIQFDVTLESGGRGGVYFTLPLKESAKFGVRGRLPVTGTINGYAFRSSIFPIGDGTHYMAVNKAVREGAKVAAGDRVKIVMEADDAPRLVSVPPDLDKALAKSKAARTRFDKLSYTHRKEYAQWIESAKRPDTRARRIEVVLARLRAE